MSDRALVVELGLDAIESDIVDQMQRMKRCRAMKSYDQITCTIRGFENDERELFEIPEVRQFCDWLVELGFISFLDFETMFSATKPNSVFAGWGASEVWLCAKIV